MFKQARLRLTGWYLLIIMTISLAFSGVIYRSANFELRRFAEAQQNRFERRLMPYPPIIDDELFIEAQDRIKNSLILINLTILSVSAVLGYYLSGKTLMPIKQMMDEQYRFVSDASHELKTPLTALRTSMEVTLRDKTSGETVDKAILRDNLQDVIRLQKLTEGLLELSSSRTMTLTPNRIDEILGNAIEEVQPLLAVKKITVKAKTGKNIIILAEPASLTRALVTILDNAIKYSHKGGAIKVEAIVKNKQVRITVKDEGIGIEDEELALVTERFYRSDKARSTSGYGLGLAIAKNIVESNRGMLNIKSKVGVGTTVAIVLPYSASIQQVN